MTPRPGITLFIAGALVVLTFSAFSPALLGEFLSWDDHHLLIDNPAWRPLGPAALRWAFSATLLGHYQPLTWLSYSIDHALWGMNPAGFHLVNILIHALNALLVFLLARRLITIARAQSAVSLPVTIASAIAAALWALHPLRVESVAWITERRDVLSTLFLLLAALAYLRAVVPSSPAIRAPAAYALAIALLALSLLSKAWGMSFFVIVIILDWYPLRRLPASPLAWFSRDALRVLAQKLPFLLLGLLAAFMAARAQYDAVATKTLQQWGITERFLQACSGLVLYIARTLWPVNLSPLYELPTSISPGQPLYLIPVLLVIGAAITVFLLRRSAPAILAAAAVYVVLLAPVLGFLQSGDQFVADRYSYIATIGLFILTAAAALALWQRTRPRLTLLLSALSAVLILTLSALTFSQSAVWRSTLSLWSSAARATPTSQVLTNFAIELNKANRPREAADALRRAVQANPTDGRAAFMLGNLSKDAADYPAAERAFLIAAQNLPQAYIAYVNLGALYLKHLNRPDDAIKAFRAAVADVERGGRRPLSAMPYLALGDALRKTGDIDGARAAFTKALDFDETKDQARRELDRLPPAREPGN